MKSEAFSCDLSPTSCSQEVTQSHRHFQPSRTDLSTLLSLHYRAPVTVFVFKRDSLSSSLSLFLLLTDQTEKSLDLSQMEL